ncbi:MAG: thymidylate kinase [bacterium]|nr:thymidylate kinase [bacterium]
MQGKLFVIDGGDGTGKTDQFKLLVSRLEAEGHKVAKADFPRYGNPASFFVSKYLQKKEFGFQNGYGSASNVNPYGASLAYALDRFDAAFCHEQRPNLWDLLNDGYHIVSNRYTAANVGYQASKIDDPDERVKFIKWLMHLEYEVLGIPQPDLVLILDLEPSIARELKARQRREQGLSLDAHEGNNQILDNAREVYLEAAKLFPDTWTIVSVGTKPTSPNVDILSGMHTREVIHEMIWSKVKPFLI